MVIDHDQREREREFKISKSRQFYTLAMFVPKVDIGSREVVGFGANGEVTYIDSVMAPFPAIRFFKLNIEESWKDYSATNYKFELYKERIIKKTPIKID